MFEYTWYVFIELAQTFGVKEKKVLSFEILEAPNG